MRFRGGSRAPSKTSDANYDTGTKMLANIVAFVIASPLLMVFLGFGDWLGVVSGKVESTVRVHVQDCRTGPWKLGLVSTCEGMGTPVRTAGSGEFTVTYEGYEREVEIVTRSSLEGTVEAEKRCALVPSRYSDGETCRYWDPRIPASSKTVSVFWYLGMVLALSTAIVLLTPGLKRRIAERQRRSRDRRPDLADDELLKPIRLDP